MKKTTLYAIIFLFSFTIINAQNEIFKPRNPEFEFFDYSNDTIIVPLKSPIIDSSGRVVTSKIPYPIIFIHGLNSSSETWNTSTNYLDSQYGFTFGGRFDFCLSADGNHNVANKNFYPTTGADIAAFETTTMQNGDYYYVNFDVNINGSIGTSVYSNQSAVTKQGVAVKKAVERVLALTGKDKVILVGHSMGGLASREYIQNSINWQPDGQHHVAKFFTLGTPHGGSNASDIGLGWIIGMETRSEALRDLKITYYYSGEPSRYLFGGVEVNNSSNMNEHLFGSDYWNIDVNCNGSIGNTIVGINQKPIDNLIDFSSVIGRVNGSSTDGVVTEAAARMENYFTGTGLTYPIKYFYYSALGIEVHTALPSQPYYVMQGLDEPNVKELAYKISTNTDYRGFTTVQASGTTIDDDFYKFTVTDNVNAAVSVSSIVTSTMNATILNSTGTAIGASQNNTGSTINLIRILTPGDYFLKISSTTPTNTNYQTPYVFNIATTLGTNDNEFNSISYYPNPVKDILTIENYNYSKASVYSILGQLLSVKSNENNSSSSQINMSNYSNGIYILVLENELGTKTIKVIKE
ncbi:alpha/beta fold hydrolase [Flavobacterium sp.]|jgi:pimeloyl-ACP methyl ester carboxylesterase|uniref:alpha/beta fold hydrolase n=1 Tax=Flavobacterium sp. TaxID=239 RepID=UPI002A7F62FD|nr:alpha/beta fold hydrolase [Flavobacterium sp.]